MTPTPITYTLNITFGEALFVADQLGLTHWPMFLPGLSALAEDELREEQRAGRSLLETRKLLTQRNGNWQIDAFLASAVQWMATPDHLIRLNQVQRAQGAFSRAVYVKAGKALLVEYYIGEFRTTLHADISHAQADCLTWLGVNQQQAASPLPPLSRADFLAFESALGRPDAAQHVWTSAQFFSAVSCLRKKANAWQVEHELGFVGNAQELWWLSLNDTQTYHPMPISAELARQKVFSIWPG